MRKRIPVYFLRLGSSDYLDWVMELSRGTLIASGEYNPKARGVGGGWINGRLEIMTSALCDVLHQQGQEFDYGREDLHYALNTPFNNLMQKMTDTLMHDHEWQGSPAEAWLAAVTEQELPLPFESMSMPETYCNFWLRAYIPKSKLEPMMECSLLSVKNRGVLDLDNLGKQGLQELFLQYPGIVVNPLLLGRVATMWADPVDKLGLFTFGFMLPVLRAANDSMSNVLAECDRIARHAAKYAFTPRAEKVMTKLGGLYLEAQAMYLGWIPTLRPDGTGSSDMMSVMIEGLGIHPIRDWSFVGLRDAMRNLFIKIFSEQNRGMSGQEVVESKRIGERDVEMMAFFFRKLETCGYSSSQALAEALEVVRARKGDNLGREVEITHELMQIVASNSDNRY